MLFNKKIEKLVFIALLAISSLSAEIIYDIQNKKATCASIKDTIEFLKSNNKTITKFYLNISEQTHKPFDIFNLAMAIKNNKTITELILNLSDSGIENGEVASLAKGIEYNSTITDFSLNISNNRNIGYDGVKYLVTIIEKNIIIKKLNLYLGYNNINTHYSVMLFADAIKNNSTITDFGIKLSDIGPDDIKALFNAIANNKTITKLSFGLISKQIEDGDIKSLSAAIENNTVIKKLLLDFESDNLDLNTLKPIAAAIGNNETIKQFVLLCSQSSYKSMWDISKFFYNTIDSNKVKTNITFK